MKKKKELILNEYLEGFKDAAEIFGQEAGISLNNIDFKNLLMNV